MLYKIEILDNSQNFLAPITINPPLNQVGERLKYTKKLSDWGICKFRVGTRDPLFGTEGDILQPFKNHVRIKRDNVIVWQGVIVKNTSRNSKYIEVEARTYLYLLDRVLIRHDVADGSGSENYRTFKSGTMAAGISTLITEAKTDMGTVLTPLTTGTVDNPTFPADFKDSAGTALSGSWTFSNTFQIKFDYRSLLYVLQTLGMYCNFDFELTNAMAFNFKQSMGNKQPDLRFTYGSTGNIEDYDAPLDGEGMANFIQGVAADNDFNIIKAEVQDADSMASYGKISAIAAYADVKNANLLKSRIREELSLAKTPDAELHIVLNDRAYPQGTYDIGDTIPINIQDHIISTNSSRRIVGMEVSVKVTGDERVRLMTNKPRDSQ